MKDPNEVYEALSVEARCTYRGIYQAYSWQQGYENEVMRFRLPDEMLTLSEDVQQLDGFVLRDFMAVVANLDDGGIHVWRYFELREPGRVYTDCFLWLACTEDDSMTNWSAEQEEQYYTAHADVWY